MPAASSVKVLAMLSGAALRVRCREEFAALGLDVFFCPAGRASLREHIALNRPAACLVDWALMDGDRPVPAAPPFFALAHSHIRLEEALRAGCEKAFLLPADWRYIALSLRRRLGLAVFPAHTAAEKADAFLREVGLRRRALPGNTCGAL